MKKKLLLKTMLLLWALIVGSSSVWADEVTYTFTSKAWADSENAWTSGKDGNQMTTDRGVQVTTGVTGANATTKNDFANVSKIVVTYSTNASKGAGDVSIQVGSNDAIKKDVTSSGGTTDRTLEYTYISPQSGGVKITVACSQNSIYIKSVAITYSAGGGGDTPTTYSVTYDANGATSGDVPTDENKYEKDAVVTVLGNTGSLAKTGCAFGGWNTQANGEGDYYDENATFNISANTTLYAMWTPYTITALTNNESYGTVSLNGSVITATPATGYTYAFPAYTVNPENSATVVQDGNTFTVTPTADTEVTINFESLPTHTATFSVNGVASSQDYKEGEAIVFPDDPAKIEGKTFVGWTATAIDGTTNDKPDFETSATMGNSDLTYYAVFAYANTSSSAVVVDKLNRELTGISGTNYDNWSGKTATSSAVYKGQSAGGNDAIQLRSNNSNSGIVTTTSGGKVKKVSITWNSNTDNARKIDVYGKNTAYSAATELYSTGTQGTKLGTIECSNNADLNIEGDYEYIGIRSQSGALYMDEVVITWSTGGGTSYSDYCTTVAPNTKLDPGLSFAVTEVNANISEQFEAPTLNTAEGFNGTVEYESSDETVAQIMDSEKGEIRLLMGGTATITATFAGNDDFKAGSASYTLNVTDDRIATTISVEDIVLDIADIATLTQLNPVVKDANDNIIDCTYEDFPPKVSYEIVSDDNYIIGSLDNNSGEIFLNNVLGTVTLKACYNAFNVNNTYKPSECTFTITVEKVMTISEVRAQGEGSVTTKGVVTSCSGTTAYIQDANAAICVYGSALTVGDEVKVKGTLTTYNGLLEITSPTVTVLSQNNTMTPEVMTIYQINESLNQGWLVKIENAKVTAIDGLNTTIAQDGNTIVARGITADIAVNDIITLTGNIGCYKVAQIANPTDVTITAVTITLADACNDGEGNYYGTYSNASAFIVPDDLIVAEVGIDGNSKLIVETYETGDVVPANTGVMVSSATAGAHVVLLSTGGTSVLGNNNSLRATGNEGITADAMNTADNDCVFYRLTMHKGTDLGFYWGAEEGAAFAVAANKAYLAVPESAGARIQGFSFVDVVTGISQIENGKLEAENYFDLQGRRVANPAKGLYIKNGKKVMVK